MSRVDITLADPTEPEARTLIAALDDYLNGLYTPEDNHLLDPEQLRAPNMRFLLARVDGVAAGCGALRLDAAGYAEVKRMFVWPDYRGRGLARSILAALEARAKSEGIGLLKLETGELQAEAVALYRGLGFTTCASFADYPCNGASIFLEKHLSQGAPASPG